MSRAALRAGRSYALLPGTKHASPAIHEPTLPRPLPDPVPAFQVLEAEGTPVPVVLSSPHSGRHYPPELLTRLAVPAAALRSLEDGPLDRLIAPCRAQGVPAILATYARAYVDLNREPAEIDPGSLEGVAAALGGPLRLTSKVRAGLGVVPTRLGEQPIYRRKLPPGDLEDRLARVYHPYHAHLGRMLDEQHRRFGIVLLLDCHSMPAEAASLRGGGRPADVVLGDRYGRACDARIVQAAQRWLEDAGFVALRNQPYAGGYITERYGDPARGRHALQIELRRGLFMDEATGTATGGLARIGAVLCGLVRELADHVARLAR